MNSSNNKSNGVVPRPSASSIIINKLNEVINKISVLEQAVIDLSNKIDCLGKNNMDFVKGDWESEELYELKKKMSWHQLHVYTGIPLSTLQYRVRTYKNKLTVDDDDIII